METDLLSEKYYLYDTPAKWYVGLMKDIIEAKKYIYIETYRLNDDSVGKRFLEVLSEKCKQGLDVRLLVDSWGTNFPESFFDSITSNGGNVKYFDKLKFSLDYFSKNHQRNHRKIVIIDDHITHFGSANITEYAQNWRESILQLNDDIALTFKRIFLENWRNANSNFFKKHRSLKTIRYRDFHIIRDIPSIYYQKIKTHFEKEIRKAKKEIIIVTPYFLPGYKLRRQMILAARRGVAVNVYIPSHSDVRLVDYLRDKYLGFLHQNKINLFFYKPTNLHAKLMLVDNEKYTIGSSNFDYRSFRYMHEIALSGNNKEICNLVNKFIVETQKDSNAFDFNKWKNRSVIDKFIGWLLIPFRHLL